VLSEEPLGPAGDEALRTVRLPTGRRTPWRITRTARRVPGQRPSRQLVNGSASPATPVNRRPSDRRDLRHNPAGASRRTEKVIPLGVSEPVQKDQSSPSGELSGGSSESSSSGIG